MIDGHSKGVARKHYLLRDPEADARLAERLVEIVLGDTVPWPSAAEIAKLRCQGKMSLPDLLLLGNQEEAVPANALEDEDEEEEDEGFLAWMESLGVMVRCAPEGMPMPLADFAPEGMPMQAASVEPQPEDWALSCLQPSFNVEDLKSMGEQD